MRHAIAAGLGLSPERVESLRRAIGPDAVVDTHGDAVVAHSGASPAVRSSDGPAGPVAVFGSGLRPGATVDATHRPDLRAETLLDASDDDLVAVAVDGDGLRAAAGPGNHRLFETTLPEGGTLVTSQLDVVIAVRGADLEVDRSHEDFLLAYGFVPDARTVYRDVTVLPPGTRRRFGTTTTSEPIGAAEPPPLPTPGDFDGAVDALHDELLTVVEQQAGDDRHHAVLLGGFDSALVVACLRRLGHEVDTFTFGFGDPTYEQRNASSFARDQGATHHVVTIERDEVMDRLERFSHLFPSPGAQPHYQIHTLLACERIAAAGFDHVLTGDGCDSIFLGYPTVSRRAGLVARMGSLPGPVAAAARRGLSTHLAERHLGHVARMGRGILANLELPMPERGHLPTAYLDEVALGFLRTGPAPTPSEPIPSIRRRLAAPVAGLDPVRLAFHGNGLNGQSQAKVDGSLAATGVVQATPFRHTRLKRLVASMPTDFLRPPGADPKSAGKAVLVEMVRRNRLLPDSIIDMPKQSPSDSPIDSWYAQALRPRVEALLDDLPFALDEGALDDVLRPKRAEQLFRDRVSISHHTMQAIGLLCSYASFTRRSPA